MLTDFRKRGREGEREGEKHPLVASPKWPDQGRNLGMCPDWGLNPQPFGSWDMLQPTEPPARAIL